MNADERTQPDTFDMVINCYTQRENVKRWMKWKEYFLEKIVEDEDIKIKNKKLIDKLVKHYIFEKEINDKIDHIPLVLRSMIVKYLAAPVTWNICVDLNIMMI